MKDLRKKLLTYFSKFWPFVFLVGLTLVFFYPVFLEGKIPLPLDALVGAHVPWTEVSWEGYPAGVPIKNLEISDSFSQFYPWRTLVGEFWRVGKIPLWNPYMFSGTPFLATLHSAAIYPLNVFYLFLSNHAAWTSLVVSQIFLSALFMYIFLKSFDFSKLASLFGAIIFSLSGYMIGWLEFGTGGHAGLWLPLLLVVERKLLESKKMFWLLTTAAIFFFIYTAGDFQVPLYITITYIALGFYLAYLKKSWKSLILIFTALLSGILLSLPQFLPTFELYLNSVRVGDFYVKEFVFGLMGWEKIVNFIWPDFYGNIVTGNYWGRFTHHEYVAFAGGATLIFVAHSLITKKQRMEYFFWFLLIVSLLFLFPTSLAFLPYKLQIPGLGTSFASRIIFLVNFCLATLATFGFSKYLSKPYSQRRAVLKSLLKILAAFLAVTALVAIGLIYFISQGGIPNFASIINLKVSLRNMIPTTFVLLALTGVFAAEYIFKSRKYIHLLVGFFVLFLLSAELLRFAWKITPFSDIAFSFPKTETIDFLKRETAPFRIAGGIPTNLFMPYKLESVEGYDPLYPILSAQWISAMEGGEIDSPARRYGLIHNFSSPLLNWANVKYIVDYKKGPGGEINKDGQFNASLKSPRFEEVFKEGRVSVFKNTENLPRIWFSREYEIINDLHAIIDELKNPLSLNQKLIILESDLEVPLKQKEITYTIDNFEVLHNGIAIDAFVSDDALLFVSQTFYPGWRAFVDGEETEVLKANFTYQSIVFPKGSHNVEFIYDPKSFKIGKRLSIVTAISLITLLIYDQIQKNSREAS